MSGFSTLEIGKKALLAQRFGLEVTSNNIANVNTPGYSRRAAVLSEDISIRRNGFFMGNGVIVQKIQSFRSDYYDREIRAITSRKAAFDVDTQYLKRIETALGEPTNDDLDTLMTEFYKSFDQAALNPDNLSFRSYIIDTGVTLAERMNRIANSVNELRYEAQNSINDSTKAVNTLLKDLVELNKLSAYNRHKNDDSSMQFIDQRELKLQELSKFFDIKVSQNDDTTVNVFLNGINLVSGVYYSEVNYRVVTDPLTTESTIELFRRDIDTGTETNLQPQSGEIFANMRLYNELLDPVDSSNNFSIASQFNEFVNTFATKFNEIIINGFGANDTDPLSPPERPFFVPYNALSATPSAGINAFSIQVNPDLINNPYDLPLSAVAGEPGNTDIARQLARMSEDKSFLNNQNPIEYYSSFIARVGSEARQAVNGYSNSKLIDEQLNTQRESLMGVNLDEEAVNLIKFQKAFEASSRIISVTNELLTTLINLGK
ncbi:MAG: flagellar hook-associated protein FlgK [Candidatus Kapabacteria bacterium]|nr:flagellar hook-associated protein FlgK [Ignavibacteriota bacterium]MCW5885783.1 flagellar hook-associated protein FlgK [Candidatus Kapabacteria bacterium]